jgi:uncharacterized protein YjiK
MIPRVIPTVTCALLMAAAWASFDGAAQAKDKKKRQGGPASGSKPAQGENAQGVNTQGQKIAVTGVREPSGIAFHPGLRHLFVVGDEGTVAELDENGRTLRVDPVRGNLEDLVFHPPSGLLVLLVEDPPGLVVYDPAAHEEKRRIGLDVAALLQIRAPQGGKGQGFEGLAFRPEAGRAGGGVFYLAHQRSPARVVAVAIDPAQAASVDNAAVVTRWPLDRYQRLTAISYEASLGRFLLIADRKLAIVDGEGTVESEHALPAVQPEGVCLDGSGALWIADDPAGLLRFAGGVAALR